MPAVELTVLGKSPAVPDPGGASSGYLVSDGEYRVLIDCGTGVLAKLCVVCEPSDVNAVVITHLHADHIADLLPYSHALTHAYRDEPRPRLLAPPGAGRVFSAIGEAYGVGRQIHDGFAFEEYDPDRTTVLGPLRLSHCEVPHFIRAWACELEDTDGRRFSFGADCAPNDALPAFAQGTDLLMLEATEGPSVHEPAPGRRGHMTAREAGQLARAAQAGRLVLTHFAKRLDARQMLREGEAGFDASLELAYDGARFTV